MQAGDDELRRDAANWFARMRAPDADRDRAGFEAWRAADPAHAETYDRLLRRWDQAAFLANTAVGRGRRLDGPAARPHRFPGAGAIAAATVAALLAGAAWLFEARTLAPGRPAQATVALASSVGEIRAVALADGSRVTLDTDTRLEIAFSPGMRRVSLLRGRARFEVAPDAARPFTVSAGDSAVVARGTVFDVAFGPAGLRVALFKGVVDISRSVPGRGFGTKRLIAGQQLAVPAAGVAAAPTAIPVPEAQWTTGMLAFDATRLDAAVAEVNRYNRAKLAVGDEAAGALRVTGAYRATDPRGFATAVADAFHLRIERRADGSLVLASGATAAP